MKPNNIKKFRQLNEMTQGELAEQIGITRQTLMRYESGQSIKMKPEIINRISEILKVSTESLLNELPVPLKEIRKIPFATDYSGDEWVIEDYIDLLFDENDSYEYIVLKCPCNDLYSDIKPGEPVLFRISNKPSDGQLVLVYNEEKDQIGLRYFVLDQNEQSALLLANNRNIRPIIFRNDDEWKILGVGLNFIGSREESYY